MNTYEQIMQKYTTQLAEQRLLLNQWVSNVMTQYNKLPDEIKAQLPPLPGTTATEMVPALFAEPITSVEEAAYTQQIQVLENFVAACNAKIDEINASEAVRCRLS